MKKGSLLITCMCLTLALVACTQVEDIISEDDSEIETSIETTTEEETSEQDSNIETSTQEETSENLTQDETFEIIDTDVENVLQTLSEQDLSTDHWQGFYYTNEQNEYTDYGYGYNLFESIDERVIVASNEGELTAIEEFIVSIYGYEIDSYSQYGYFDGLTLYERSYGVSDTMEVPNMNKGTFTSYPQQVLEMAVEQYTDFIGLTEYMPLVGYTFSGSIEKGSEGSTKISVNIDADYTEEYDGEEVEFTGFMLLELLFDSDSKLVNLTYNVQESYEYDSIGYFLTQTLTANDYLEECVEEPSWLDTYFPDR